MAYPSTEVNRFRNAATGAIENLRELDAVLAIVEDHGADDAARATFFQAEFGTDSNNPDITWSEFVAGVQAFRAIVTARDNNILALAKLLK